MVNIYRIMPRSKSLRKYQKQLMDINKCMSMKLKQIRKTTAYKNLIPYGVGKRKAANPNQKYHFGNKSTMRKGELCEALSQPQQYHRKIRKAYGTGKRKSIKPTGPRKRYSRTGDCRPYRRKPPCKAPTKFKGVTTTGKKCCYKKRQSEATKQKRLANKSKKIASKARYNKQKKITQKGTRPKRKSVRPVVSKKSSSRKGECRPSERKPPCKEPRKFEGVTTTGKKCCYKRKQSEATRQKRLAN